MILYSPDLELQLNDEKSALCHLLYFLFAQFSILVNLICFPKVCISRDGPRQSCPIVVTVQKGTEKFEEGYELLHTVRWNQRNVAMNLRPKKDCLYYRYQSDYLKVMPMAHIDCDRIIMTV